MSFDSQLIDFNKMYDLPVNHTPTNLGLIRLYQLRKTLLDEVVEIDEIIDASHKHAALVEYGAKPGEIHLLVAMADLMGDLQVYCGSEMVKWGLPREAVLYIIMASNMSKLGADGQPIVVDGKVQKGPHYWKPEPLIHELLKWPEAIKDGLALNVAKQLVAAKQAELALVA